MVTHVLNSTCIHASLHPRTSLRACLRPVSGVKRGLEDSPCTSSTKRLTTPQPLASKPSLSFPRGAKRSIPFDDATWRSPNKLHKQVRLEQVQHPFDVAT